MPGSEALGRCLKEQTTSLTDDDFGPKLNLWSGKPVRLLSASSNVIREVTSSLSKAKSSPRIEESVVCHDKADGQCFDEEYNSSLSTSRETLAAVKALVVLAVKKTVSGVTAVSGSSAKPYAYILVSYASYSSKDDVL